MIMQDIQKLLVGHSSVRELCVMASPGKARKKRYWAFVALAKVPPNVIYDFHVHCAARLSGIGFDVRVKILPDLPKNPSGAVSRRELARLCAEQTAQVGKTSARRLHRNPSTLPQPQGDPRLC